MSGRRGIKLTDRAVSTAQVPEAGYTELWDSVRPGLHLRIFSTGGRVWSYRYRFEGRQRRAKLGRYPELSLADGRAAAKAMADAVARGEDPAVEPENVRPARQLAALRRLAGELGAEVSIAPGQLAVVTFGELVERYLAEHASRKRSGAEDARLLARDALPAWRHRPADGIRRGDVKALLDTVVARGATVSANRLRAVLSSVFAFGMDVEICDANPARDTRRPTTERPRERVLTDDELRALWAAFDTEHPIVCALFRLLALTGQRSGEVRRLRWTDLDGDLWTIPGAFTKGARPHVVPLPPPAMAIIEGLRVETKSSSWVLESPRRAGHPLAVGLAHAAARIGRRAGVRGWSPHDLRRTVATRLGGMGLSEVVPAVLGHAAAGVTARVYNLHDRLAEKREALQRWSSALLAVVGTAEPAIAARARGVAGGKARAATR